MTAAPIQSRQRPARLLLVEDNEGDIVLTKRAFLDAKIANELFIVRTGEQAVEFLTGRGEWEQRHLPDLILLDLNLPTMSGQEVLQFIKNDHHLKRIPVIILSSSTANQDVIKSYDLHANGYVVKPVNLTNFHDVVAKLEQFWFALVVVPTDRES